MKKEGLHCRACGTKSTDFVGLPTALSLKYVVLVLAMPVHGAQFNGKQEGGVTTTVLTCAAPATVSRRVVFKQQSSFHLKPLAALKQTAGKVVKVASASPDTGQQGDLLQDRL